MASEKKQDSKSPATLTQQMVLDYLQQHPDFLRKHPELLEVLTPPEQQTGDNVVDFQSYALTNLQKEIGSLKDKFNGLLLSARDNMSVQSQVHNAVLGLIKARDLEHLLEVVTMDFVSLFDVDVVRLAMESEMSLFYDASGFGERGYSGVAFIEPGMIDQALGVGQIIQLVPDVQEHPPHGFFDIFTDVAGLVASCALLRLKLEKTQRHVMLAFGVREPGRFHPGQGVDLLAFLAEIVEYRLDQCLSENEIEKLF